MDELEKDLLLLDTHVWIWLMIGADELKSSKCLPVIKQSARQSKIRISAISVWEIGMLEARRKIRFTVSCTDWVNEALSAPGVSLEPLAPEIAIESSRLPGDFHGDPADRIIVATARKLGATLVSGDKEILGYSEEGYIKTLPV